MKKNKNMKFWKNILSKEKANFNEIEYIKLDYDDICEIIVDYYRDRIENSSSARCLFLGTPKNELRLIAAFSDNREAIDNLDLMQIDKEMDYNGEHAFIKKAGYGYRKK